MGFRINTNIGAMNAHNWGLKTGNNLNNSLQKLSSGLRINKAADDSSGMAIADSLKAQAKGLGQAIANANDGIGVVQTADGALNEYLDIVNTIRTKSIQAASDGQSADSRIAIQNDINKLLENAQSIATNTSFNGQSLLNGAYGNKNFQIGAYAGETVNISIGDTQTKAVGEFALSEGTSVAAKTAAAAAFSNTVSITGLDSNGKTASFTVAVAYTTAGLKSKDGATSLEQSRALVDAINAKAQKDGVEIRASVYETKSSTVDTPLYGIRLDSSNDFTASGVSVADGTKEIGDHSLADIDVRTREGAQKAVIITDYAIKELDKTRSEIGSVQNQLESTIRNISVSRVNVTAAESQIRDVDFASESSNFAKNNILAQSGTYAMSQANAIQQNVMRLLQ